MSWFFTPIPCTYTSLPLDGMPKNYFCLRPSAKDQGITSVGVVVVVILLLLLLVLYLVHFLIKRNLRE